jgi:hypothetical protein
MRTCHQIAPPLPKADRRPVALQPVKVVSVREVVIAMPLPRVSCVMAIQPPP